MSPLDVCIIDADAAARERLVRRLLAGGFSVFDADDAERALAQVRHHHPRVLLCGVSRPELGTELCSQIRSDPQLDGSYLVFLNRSSDRALQAVVLNSGADDCLNVPCADEELMARLRYGLRMSALQERLRRAALTDGLTGLWNHSQFRELLAREFSRTRRYGGVTSLLMLDLDHFKAVNDTYGHEIGNHVLKATARHLLRLVRDTDIVSRYGGEEFTVICPETQLEEAARLAERIRQTLPDDVRVWNCPNLRVTGSIGVCATSQPQVHSVRDLINLADQALYSGKHQGRDRVIRADKVPPEVPGARADSVVVDRLQKQVVSLSMQAKELCLQSVWALMQALEARDPYTAWHSRNTKFYAEQLAAAAGMPEALRTAVANAAMLHDLGKIGVPDEVLSSSARLTQEQQAILREVPMMTCKILEPLRIFEVEILIIRHLRERFDGSGYPLGLAGKSIPLGSRLLAVAEAFDAMTSERPYRASRNIAAAAAAIEAEAGKQFDPEFTALLGPLLRREKRRWLARVRRAKVSVHRGERSQAEPRP